MTAAVSSINAAPDFPDWFSPLLVKDLRQGLRSRWFIWLFLWVQFSMVVLVAVHMLYGMETPGGRAGTMGKMWMDVLFFANITLVLHVLLPLRGIFIADADVEPGNLPLLRVTGVLARRIAVSKLVVTMFMVGLIMTTMLPYITLRYFLSGVDVVGDFMRLAWIGVASGVIAAWGLLLAIMPAVWRAVVGGLLILGGLPIFESILWMMINVSRDWSAGVFMSVLIWLVVAIFVAVLPLAIVESRFNDGRSVDWQFHAIPASPPPVSTPTSSPTS
ncbi:hypothetical protein DES53_11368 [Roseimicrobium gellanilyticum]|uniref:ABC-2 family transporter n=1 Tax=Roseimicrobium gellanilyticum TaxID=748857 RepID=A0A366H7Z7_9BACT|nr:hypothetical protein [Roseimicrobium gellanilyticum]RBP37686.1 hypothetical protein DES53_11368 [Roseimicrobium gellanilyticum]